MGSQPQVPGTDDPAVQPLIVVPGRAPTGEPRSIVMINAGALRAQMLLDSPNARAFAANLVACADDVDRMLVLPPASGNGSPG